MTQHAHAVDPRDRATHTRRQTYTAVRRATAERLERTPTRTGPAHSGIGAGDVPAHVSGVVPCWLSRRSYLAAVATAAETPKVQALCRRAGISPTTWAAILTEAAHEAESGTGRLRITHDHLARIVCRSTKQIQRALRVARVLGLAAPLHGARELGREERLTLVAEHPGHQQRGIPPVWQLAAIPPAVTARLHSPKGGRWVQPSIRDVHLPRRGNPCRTTSREHVVPFAADAARTAPPPAAQPGRRRSGPGPALAWALTQHPHLHLLRGVDPRTLIGLLTPHAASGWTAGHLADALNTEALRCRIDTRYRADSPHGLLRMLLDRIDHDPIIHTHGPAAATLPTCQRADCDGHGWLIGNAAEPARKCPDCPATARTNRATW